MSEIGTERLEPTAPVGERVSNEGASERGPRPRRPVATVPADSDPEPAAQSETTPHQVDSLA
ncbi:MAG: hypothetical protein WBX03_03035 [Terriglobales bacterium]|jgi:hypothetical protein